MIGSLLDWRRLTGSTKRLLFGAIAATLSLPLLWLFLGWVLPRAAPYLPKLDSWPSTLLWIFGVHTLLLLPVAPLLGATLSRTRREAESSGPVFAGFLVGALAAMPWLQAAFAWQFGTLQIFPATAAIALAIETTLPPRKRTLIFLLLCVGLSALWPRSLLSGSLQDRFGTLLALADEAPGIAMVTDDANRGRLLRGPDGRAIYAEALAQEDRFLAHLPLILQGQPKRMLFLGRGSGQPIAAAGTHSDLEIFVRDRLGEPAHLTSWFTDKSAAPITPRTETAAACSPVSGGPFDVILLQPPMVTSQAFAACLSQSFLDSIAEALAPDGLYAVKIDPGTLPVEELALVMSELTTEFLDVTIWAGQPASRWIAIASKQPQSVTLASLRAFWRNPKTGASLRAAGRPTPFHLLADFLMPRTKVQKFTETFRKKGTSAAELPARTAQKPSSHFGFAAATSDDWTVAVLGGEAILPEAFGRIFAQIERAETWREPRLSILDQPSAAGLSGAEIEEIIRNLRSPPIEQGRTGRAD
ncbi:MAG: hypothetical protein P8R45_06405 [Candidatus Binatia bacterium]|nr:hypothetical protein [Candidatus Binatia bacterium]